jgi:hypothetical protein
MGRSCATQRMATAQHYPIAVFPPSPTARLRIMRYYPARVELVDAEGESWTALFWAGVSTRGSGAISRSHVKFINNQTGLELGGLVLGDGIERPAALDDALTEAKRQYTPKARIVYCNSNYSERWFFDKKTSNGIQYRIIHAIVELVCRNNGGTIDQRSLLEFDPGIAAYIERRPFRIVPSAGTEMKANGKGIHHAKYSPTKSVAILWQMIRGVVYFTFDDHAPIKYHRAIYSFHQLRLGRSVRLLNPKSSSRVRKAMRRRKPWQHRDIDLKRRFYI